MEEAERRKAFWTGRVLIESGRVLESELDDSLLCLTGAELELLRNLTMYLHRRSSFVDTLHDGYYIMPDDDDFDDITAVVAGLEEKLMGCAELEALFTSMNGYLAAITFDLALMKMESSPIPANEQIAEASDGSAQYFVEFTIVPADYRLKVYGAVAMDTSNACTQIRFEYFRGSSWRQFYTVNTVAGGMPILFVGPIVLEEGEQMRARFSGTTNLDNLRIIRWAERFEVP